MKIDIISDLHLTHSPDWGADFVASWVPEGEVLVIAGDIAELYWWETGVSKLKTLCDNYKQVLFVAGNHEYYGASFEEGDARFRETASKIDNFHFLEKNQVTIEGVTFAGTTLWFRHTDNNARYSRFLNDFRLINSFVPQVYERNQQDLDFLRSLRDVQVVITHHLPSRRSVHKKFASEPTNLFFLCDVEDIVLDLQPTLFIHGHTHIPFDYTLGDTRVICNPRGYPRERLFGDDGYRPVTITVSE